MALRIWALRFLKRRYFVASFFNEPMLWCHGRHQGGIGQHLGLDQLPPALRSGPFFVERIGHEGCLVEYSFFPRPGWEEGQGGEGTVVPLPKQSALARTRPHP